MWWTELGVFRQIMFVVAVATTVFLIIQIIMMFVGMGTDADLDSPSDIDGDLDVDAGETFHNGGLADSGGLQIFSLKSILALLGVGGWVAFGIGELLPWWAALLIGLATGACAAVGVAFMMRALYKLKSSGNISITNCIGLSGETYLTIPANRTGSGKVNVVVQEKLTEFSAVTDSDAPIKTGSSVKVTEIFNGNTLIVEPLFKEVKQGGETTAQKEMREENQ